MVLTSYLRRPNGLWETALLIAVLVSFPTSCIAVDTDFFEKRIRPVLVENCYRCHSLEGKAEGGLRVDTRESMRRGGDSGPAVMPNDLDQSLILSAIKYEDFEMPPDRKLEAHVIADFERWIREGAADPREEQSITPEALTESGIDFHSASKFWSFQPPISRPLPDHSFANWSRGRIDDFVAAKLETNDLAPSPPASELELMRRVSFDLVGLSPDSSVLLERTQNPPGANPAQDVDYEQFVDSLLSSEGFGEHWARMWMDLMRYADDQAHIVGNNTALCYPNAHLYRDWIIDAWNSDIPFDEFIKLQLAADIVTPDHTADDVALGFIGLGPKYYRRNSPEVMADEYEDRVDVLSRGLLGLTVACARCHDHKYDPIGIADYYAMAGVFASIEMFNRPLNEESKVDAKGQSKAPEEAVHIVRDKNVRDLNVAIRGDVKRPGPVVPRGFLTVLDSSGFQNEKFERAAFKKGSGRLELAEQIVSPNNPLTARVFVNRVWGKLIGEPLVGTPSNFGNLGQRPSHPELLDDLAIRFIENNWSLKWLCKEIVCSATYRQSSRGESPADDPENALLSKMNRKRLSVEQWRDALLIASGSIDPTNRSEHQDPSSVDSVRRTVYSDSSRLKLNRMLATFDYPDPNVHSDRRAETTTASQKLFFMNSPLIVNLASKIATNLSSLEDDRAIDEAYLLLFSRAPSQSEKQIGIDYLSQRDSELDKYVHALIMSNEFLFID